MERHSADGHQQEIGVINMALPGIIRCRLPSRSGLLVAPGCDDNGVRKPKEKVR
ncbi:hypothetical protein [Herbaspirillum sp. CF444]|uniref:hypothetical protein n=1 Tax=Herbaspirillum sp. CF444 TaxID=1144319 RepID=UPI0012F83A84|nr:hypothetical protein [Herbaspirillum sp. CF444]